MTRHRAVATGVYETCYENGEQTLCNYNAQPFAVGSDLVPAYGYLLLDAAGKVTFRHTFEDGLHRVRPDNHSAGQ